MFINEKSSGRLLRSLQQPYIKDRVRAMVRGHHFQEVQGLSLKVMKAARTVGHMGRYITPTHGALCG